MPSSPSSRKSIKPVKSAKIEKFEDILVWKKSQELSVELYRLLENCRDYGFKDQIQRAAISISNNIAEGYERKGDKELTKFLFIAKGSSGEVRSMLYIASELKYISQKECEQLLGLWLEISKMLSAFVTSLRSR